MAGMRGDGCASAGSHGAQDLALDGEVVELALQFQGDQAEVVLEDLLEVADLRMTRSAQSALRPSCRLASGSTPRKRSPAGDHFMASMLPWSMP